MPISIILGFLPQLISAGKDLFGLVQQARAAAQQSGEWTDDHEAQFQAALLAQGQATESQPDNP